MPLKVDETQSKIFNNFEYSIKSLKCRKRSIKSCLSESTTWNEIFKNAKSNNGVRFWMSITKNDDDDVCLRHNSQTSLLKKQCFSCSVNMWLLFLLLFILCCVVCDWKLLVFSKQTTDGVNRFVDYVLVQTATWLTLHARCLDATDEIFIPALFNSKENTINHLKLKIRN